MAPIALGAVGFTAAGIAANSLAAGMMASAATASGVGVFPGSTVAVLQSAGNYSHIFMCLNIIFKNQFT